MTHFRLLSLALVALSGLASFAQEPVTSLVFDNSGSVPYRIPAICTTKKGTLVAASDYRFTKADIGGGRLDLHVRTSSDNGKTWGEVLAPEVMTGDGNTAAGNQKCGYGDPCMVADRESGRILMTSCSGTPGFFGGTRTHHLGWAMWYSDDEGQTWSEPRYLDEDYVYAKFDDSKYGPIRGWFVGSGKIHQSRYTKVGDYYRLYCAGSSYNGKETANWVLYSDDFGQSWDILGGAEVSPVPGGDEPKCEELPNGNVLISSRNVYGRYYNIFTFANMEKGRGYWGERALSSSSVNGLIANNGCNGEVQVLPVVRKADGVHTWIALQSLPISGRTNVSIFYKDLEDKTTYTTPVEFAKNWTKGYQVSETSSAYSTWSMCNDHTIGFLYEEGGSNGGYDIVYKNISISLATGGAYEYDETADAHNLSEQILLNQRWLDAKTQAEQAYNGNSKYWVSDKLIVGASQMTSPHSQNSKGTKDGGNLKDGVLIDDDASTYWHSYWGEGPVTSGSHYLLVEAADESRPFSGNLQMNLTCRSVNQDHVTGFDVYGSDTKTGAYTKVATVAVPGTANGAKCQTEFSLGEKTYKYLRFNGLAPRGYFHMAEFQLRNRELEPRCKNAQLPEVAKTLSDKIAMAHAQGVEGDEECINQLNAATADYLERMATLSTPIYDYSCTVEGLKEGLEAEVLYKGVDLTTAQPEETGLEEGATVTLTAKTDILHQLVVKVNHQVITLTEGRYVFAVDGTTDIQIVFTERTGRKDYRIKHVDSGCYVCFDSGYTYDGEDNVHNALIKSVGMRQLVAFPGTEENTLTLFGQVNGSWWSVGQSTKKTWNFGNNVETIWTLEDAGDGLYYVKGPKGYWKSDSNAAATYFYTNGTLEQAAKFEFIEVATRVEELNTEADVVSKVIENGRLLIKQGKKTYTVSGVEVK